MRRGYWKQIRLAVEFSPPLMAPAKAQRGAERSPRHSVVSNTIALVGGLCLIVVAQFILFPLAFTYLLHDPRLEGSEWHLPPPSQLLPSGVLSASLGDFVSLGSGSSAPRRRRRRRKDYDLGDADGTFNGAPIYYREGSPTPRSRLHCVGENYQDDAWRHRSCRYSKVCFNTTSQRFVMFQTLRERLLSVYGARNRYIHSSTTMLRRGSNRTNSVSLGGINQKWNEEGIARLEWIPDIRVIGSSDETLSYYELPPDVVLIPYHSLNAANPGHLVWDDFLPMYTLLSMFQLLDLDVLPLRMELQDGQRGLWASCDFTEEKRSSCRSMIDKFGPLLLGDDSPYRISSNTDYSFLTRGGPALSELVCAPHAVAGMGSLTDHGTEKSHGWEERDYGSVHNHGRGGVLYNFRNYLLDNIGLSPAMAQTTPAESSPDRPRAHRIVFSVKSSDIMARNMDFASQVEQVRRRFPDAVVESYMLKDLSLREQLEVAGTTSVYVSLCGGGAVTAMFLPRGSSVILYYGEDMGLTSYGRPSGTPALLDWDLFNSMSHLRVHWLPRNTMDGVADERALTELIQHELDIMNERVFS